MRQLLIRPASDSSPTQSPVSAPKPWLGQESIQAGALTARELWGYAVWGFVAAIVAVFECLAAFDDDKTPWPTLSRTAGNLQDDLHWTGIPILAGLAVLTARVVFYPWPNRRSEG